MRSRIAAGSFALPIWSSIARVSRLPFQRPLTVGQETSFLKYLESRGRARAVESSLLVVAALSHVVPIIQSKIEGRRRYEEKARKGQHFGGDPFPSSQPHQTIETSSCDPLVLDQKICIGRPSHRRKKRHSAL